MHDSCMRPAGACRALPPMAPPPPPPPQTPTVCIWRATGYCSTECEDAAADEAAGAAGAVEAVKQRQAEAAAAAEAKRKAEADAAAEEQRQVDVAAAAAAAAAAGGEDPAALAARVSRAYKLFSIQTGSQPSASRVRTAHRRAVEAIGDDAAQDSDDDDDDEEDEDEDEGEGEGEGGEADDPRWRKRKAILDRALKLLVTHLGLPPPPTSTLGDKERAQAEQALSEALAAYKMAEAQREEAQSIQEAAAGAVGSLRLRELERRAGACVVLVDGWEGKAAAAVKAVAKAVADINELMAEGVSSQEQEQDDNAAGLNYNKEEVHRGQLQP